MTLDARAELSIKGQYNGWFLLREGGHPSCHMKLKAFTRIFHTHLALLCQLLLLCTSSQKPQPTLSIFSFYSLFPKINSRCICRMAIYTQAWVAGARKILEMRINLEIRGRTHAFVCVHPPPCGKTSLYRLLTSLRARFCSPAMIRRLLSEGICKRYQFLMEGI